MTEPDYFDDALEEHMRAAFAMAAHLAGATPTETARIFVSFGLAMIAEFAIGETLLSELDEAAAAVAEARAEATAVIN